MWRALYKHVLTLCACCPIQQLTAEHREGMHGFMTGARARKYFTTNPPPDLRSICLALPIHVHDACIRPELVEHHCVEVLQRAWQQPLVQLRQACMLGSACLPAHVWAFGTLDLHLADRLAPDLFLIELVEGTLVQRTIPCTTRKA